MIVEQPLVGNRDHRVDAVAQLLEAALGLELPLPPLELERLGHDRDGQRAELAGEAGDDRRGAGAGAAAEPVVTKIMSAPSSAWMIFSVSSSAADRPTFGIGAGAEPFRQLAADLQLDAARR